MKPQDPNTRFFESELAAEQLRAKEKDELTEKQPEAIKVHQPKRVTTIPLK